MCRLFLTLVVLVSTPLFGMKESDTNTSGPKREVRYDQPAMERKIAVAQTSESRDKPDQNTIAYAWGVLLETCEEFGRQLIGTDY